MRAAELVVASRHGYAKAVLTPAASRDGQSVQSSERVLEIEKLTWRPMNHMVTHTAVTLTHLHRTELL